MSAVQEYKSCKCGNQQMISNYDYKTEQLYESCDVCSYYNTVSIVNMPEDGKTTDSWKPEYETKHGETGFVVKIFIKEQKGFSIACVEKKAVGDVRKTLINDVNVLRFAVTFKDGNDYYQTQMFNKSRYRITELIELANNNPDNYVIYHEINADSEIDALKKVAIAQTDPEAKDVIKWIKSLSFTLEEIKNQLIGWGASFTEVKEIKRN